MLFNAYIDGSWLFRQCGPNGLLANQTEYPENVFRLDFGRLLSVFGGHLSRSLGGEVADPAELFLYTAIFVIPSEPDPKWGDISFIESNSHTRRMFADSAVAAGFHDEGIFDVPLRGWIVEKLRDRRYQEKMVDTSVVARIVEQSIRYPDRLHVLVSGDTDMVPAISTVVPEYTETIVLATTHPDQYNPLDAQSSFRLNSFDFRVPPLYLERHTMELAQGDFVYRCSNPSCQRALRTTVADTRPGQSHLQAVLQPTRRTNPVRRSSSRRSPVSIRPAPAPQPSGFASTVTLADKENVRGWIDGPNREL